MDIEKVGGTKGPKPQEKKERASTPDSEEFREMMKTGKVSETDFDKPKKKRKEPKKEGLGEKQAPPPTTKEPTLPSPYDSYSQKQPTAPQEPYYAEEQQPEAAQKKKRKEKKKEEKELAAFQKEKIKKAPDTLKKEKIKKPSISIQKNQKPTQQPKIKEHVQEIKVPKEKKERKVEPQLQQSTVLQEMPANIATQTQSITETLTPYLHPDIIPLFEKMVGMVVQLQAKGITTTEVMLNSPAFQSSIFYGSSIVLQKYSTAPAFNIFLRGPTQAVNMFSENLDGLFDAFKKANINIGRLEAQHEKFTFKRKEKTSGKKDTGSQR